MLRRFRVIGEALQSRCIVIQDSGREGGILCEGIGSKHEWEHPCARSGALQAGRLGGEKAGQWEKLKGRGPWKEASRAGHGYQDESLIRSKWKHPGPPRFLRLLRYFILAPWFHKEPLTRFRQVINKIRVVLLR